MPDLHPISERELLNLLEAAKAVDEYAPIVQDALDRSTRHEMNAGELGMIANLWDEKRTTLRAAIAKAETEGGEG